MAVTKFIGFGLPGALGPVIGVVESVAALLLLVGVLHWWASLGLAIIILGALVTVQIPGGITSGLERDLLILVATLDLAARPYAGPALGRSPVSYLGKQLLADS